MPDNTHRMKQGPKAKCDCGTCRLCKLREVRRRFYARHAERIKRENATQKWQRRQAFIQALKSEPSDEELDRRALVMMGRLQDAR